MSDPYKQAKLVQEALRRVTHRASDSKDWRDALLRVANEIALLVGKEIRTETVKNCRVYADGCIYPNCQAECVGRQFER
jgi:hypothetical protein